MRMKKLITYKVWLWCGAVSILAAATISLGAWIMVGPESWACRTQAASEIFQGVTYGCRQLQQTEEGRGSVHWVRIDLTVSGVELYATPLDATAVRRGWQYRLWRIQDVVNREKLAVAINGTMFASDSNWLIRMSGDFARSIETVVADHGVSHIWEHTYLLWFDNALAPHLRNAKPATAEELGAAKWGIGGQGVWLWDGQIWPGADRTPDSRTAVAIDRPNKLLYLAIGQHISPRLMLQYLPISGPRRNALGWRRLEFDGHRRCRERDCGRKIWWVAAGRDSIRGQGPAASIRKTTRRIRL